MFIEVQGSSSDVRVPYDSPDYAGVSNEDAESDYRHRVEMYKKMFEPLDSEELEGKEETWSYLKCDPARSHFVINHISGYLQLKIVHFCINLRPHVSNLYLTRHGQSEYNALGRIGGDSSLSQHGINYAHRLADWVHSELTVEEDPDTGDVVQRPCRLWTSTMNRTKETAQFIQTSKIKVKDRSNPNLVHEWVQMRARAWHHLDELFAGSCDGMTYEEIEEKYPEEFQRRKNDKLAYRYPRGESYLDVIARLEPMIIEMERHREPLLVVGHQGILRIIYAFYMGLSRAEAPYVSIPLNTVTHLRPGAFSCEVKKTTLYKIELPSDGQDEPLAVRMERQQAINDPSSH
jgi:broad specificity phosphatase PhoE